MEGEITIEHHLGTLADGDPWGLGVVEELKFSGRTLVDVFSRIGALNEEALDRITKGAEITFRVFRQHATATEALVFAATHDDGIPGVSGIRIFLTEGETTSQLLSTGCAWESSTGEPIGVSTLTEYKVTRGVKFILRSSSPSAPGDTVLDAGEYGDGYAAQTVADGGHYNDLPEPAGSPYMDGQSY